MKTLHKVLMMNNRNVDALREHFALAITDMDNQHSRIREARQGLFDMDITARDCDIDIELGRDYAGMDWSYDGRAAFEGS